MDYKKSTHIIIFIGGLIAFTYLFLNYALVAFMPFILAFIFSLFISPVARGLSKRLKVGKKFIAGVLVVLSFTLFSLTLYLGLNRLFSELASLLELLSQQPEILSGAITKVLNFFDNLFARFNLQDIFSGLDDAEMLTQKINEFLVNSINSILSTASSKLPAFAVSIFRGIPEILLFIATFLVSCFYFCVDGDNIGRFISDNLPRKIREKMPLIKQKSSAAFWGYIRAYLLIMIITTIEVFVGLCVMNINYAFLWSIVIALIDLLPIFGAGTILVPWSIISFASGDPRVGLGLLILYGIVLIVRQIIEPKIIGNSIGIHPVVIIGSVYVGAKLLGFWGLFLGPVLAVGVKTVVGIMDNS